MGLDLSRRAAFIGILAAPAIVRASSLMAIKSYALPLIEYRRVNGLIMISQITKNAVAFIQQLDYERGFVSSSLRIKLPSNFTTH